MASNFKGSGSPLLNMMADLAKDPTLKEAFGKDSDEVMKHYGIPDEQRASLKNALRDMEAGNTDSIRTIMGDEVVHPDTCIFTGP